MAATLERLSQALAERYRIERPLGRGGMATVFLAEDLRHHRQVAIKVLDPEVAAALGPERFLREIETVAKLTHPHILPLHDSGVADGLLFYVMPYVEGESLRQRLAREKQLPIEDALRIAREVADALSCAHSRGIVHRDIKPENILLEEGHAVVADFGIARAVAVGADKLTGTGIAVGTPAYMSPEQAAGGRDLDGRSDLYSLGCVLYEMLAGQPPFTGPTAESLAHQHLNVSPRPVTELRPAVPAPVAAALQRALAKTPADRFVGTDALEHELAGLEAGGSRAVSVAPPPRGGGRGWRAVGAAAVASSAVLLVVAISMWMARGRAVTSGTIRSLAVLPLENVSGDPSQAYFADGMTEELITEMSKIGALRVISRASVMRYRGARMRARDIARELGVDAIVTGAVARSPSRVRINAELVLARDERNLWADRYERDLADVLLLQDEVAREIAGAVRVRLTPDEHGRLSAARKVDPRALDACLRGRSLLERMGRENYRKAIASFRDAIAIDSTYAAAWAGLGDAYYATSNVYLPPREAMPLARGAAERALALDPDSGPAHATSAVVLSQFDRDWRRAGEECRRAIALSPSHDVAHYYYGLMLVETGRHDEGVREMELAQRLNPNSLFMANAGLLPYVDSEHCQGSVERCRAVLARDTTYAVSWVNLGIALLCAGELEECVRVSERAVALADHPFARVLLGCAYARAGRREKARAILRGLRADRGWVQRIYWARVECWLGDSGEALRDLAAAIDQREEEPLLMRVDPLLAPLRSDPRFERLARGMGL